MNEGSEATPPPLMVEQYSHTLIAKPKNFTPSASRVERFVSTMVTQKVVPGKPTIHQRAPTGQYREYPFKDPFTGENLRVEIKDHKELPNPGAVSSAIHSLQNYELEVQGVGRPRVEPLVIDFKKPYYVTMTCFVSSVLRSTSDLNEDLDGKQKATPYRHPCAEQPDFGYFTNPYNRKAIEVPDAGCARFGIQFELGKFLFPEFPNGSLPLLNPTITLEAEKIFEIEFVQGCHWA